MSLSTALESALSGLKLAQMNVSLISSNISNANNADYTKKTILSEAILSTSGQGGVKVTGYSRAVDQALNNALTTSISANGLTQAQQGLFADVKDLFGISSDTTQLSTAMSAFNNAWQVLTSSPDSSANRINVLTAGQAVATEIKRLAGGIETIDREVRQQTSEAVDDINTILGNIQSLNKQVANGQGTNQNITDIEDQRDAQVRKLAEYVDVKVLPSSQGTIRLITPQGYTLLDVEPTQLSFNGTNVMANGQNVSTQLTGGKISALIAFRSDTSPATVSADPATEVIRKLRSQLELVTQGFLGTTGSPATFAAAYNNATTVTGEQASGFFTGSDRYDIAVNANLLNGTTTIKAASAQAVSDALADGTRSYAADGISIQNVSYAGYANAMLSGIGNASAAVSTKADLNAATMSSFKERFASSSNVNVDTELASLAQVQNSYASSARVISAINEMFDTLDRMMG